MRLVCDPAYDEVDLSASAEELNRLADAVAQGEGLLTSSPGGDGLAGVEVKNAPGPGVLVHLDSERQFLVISGDSTGRSVLADNLRGMASAEDGGHLHVEYPGHDYLVEGSVPLVVNSPHGGMPTR
ncbi:Imm32 family immunity protein [Streptomyces olivoreticuli]|uniref:Imm32 family immunity protein n=1 Tax=Streptomyces olivoreticuli TaxID=68246 RepID=UPI000E24953B|nr:hypothetical protein [Streptomyces olivoreticuli]